MLHDHHAQKREKPESCATCRFFFPSPKNHEFGGLNPQHTSGDCRRLPPAANYNGHPTTSNDGWCGEYKLDKHKEDHIKQIEKEAAEKAAKAQKSKGQEK